jgi:hypothetical protein
MEEAAADDHRGVASLIEKVMSEWLAANGYKVAEAAPKKAPAARKRRPPSRLDVQLPLTMRAG